VTDFFSQVLPALLIVIGLPLGVLWWNRRTRTGVPGRLSVTDRAAFGRTSWVAVVEVDRRRFLVGAAEHGINLISELERAPEPVDDGEPVPGLPYATDGNEDKGPRSGLIRRLQQMTLRAPAESPWRALRDRHR
jgi:flagellar biogenesis protein FliO